MNHKREQIVNVDGQKVNAICPIIVSASRATDIPAFYSDWLINRISAGYVKWKNPFNGRYSYVSFANTRLFVFWTKNPAPLIEKLNYFDDNNYGYYFQFTLNNYEDEGWEPNLPSLDRRIETFIHLSETIGKEKVIWRFDPIIISSNLSPDDVLGRIKEIGDIIHPYTERLVFSFVDVAAYRRVSYNLRNIDNTISDIDFEKMRHLARGIATMNQEWFLELGTCSEKIDLDEFNIEHNRCIDDRLIIRLFEKDQKLIDFLGYTTSEQLDLFDEAASYNYKKIRDKGQRKECGCIKSKDIGQYNTCPHGCIYCYANTNPKIAKMNYKHTKNTNDMLL